MEVYQKADAVYLYIDCKGEASVKEIYGRSTERLASVVAAPRVHGDDMTYLLYPLYGGRSGAWLF